MGVGLTLLAIPGVVLSALIVGVAAMWAFGVPFEVAFLIGAVLAPTDPAILIPLFERLRVRRKVAQTVIAESALNDATGAVLALSVAAFVLSDGSTLTEPLVDFVRELAVSTALGLVFGLVLALVLSHGGAGLWRESSAVVLAAVVAANYVSTDAAGGSGYMGAFVTDVVAGNADSLRLGRAEQHDRELRYVSERITDVVVLFVFVVVGANLPLGAMADNAAPALATLAVLPLGRATVDRHGLPPAGSARAVEPRRDDVRRLDARDRSRARGSRRSPGSRGRPERGGALHGRGARYRRDAGPPVDHQGLARAPARAHRGASAGNA
ncbi:MAG: cation:proton antiporter [Actinobacteria bacterium]|nr:cation:proton antiporter [Actinomycetota bacterium]